MMKFENVEEKAVYAEENTCYAGKDAYKIPLTDILGQFPTRFYNHVEPNQLNTPFDRFLAARMDNDEYFVSIFLDVDDYEKKEKNID